MALRTLLAFMAAMRGAAFTMDRSWRRQRDTATRKPLGPWTASTQALADRLLKDVDAHPPEGSPGGCADSEGETAVRARVDGPRVAVLTGYSGVMPSEYVASLEQQRRYAKSHGYIHIFEEGRELDEMGKGDREVVGNSKYWLKWVAITKQLPHYDLLLWLDLDTAIINSSIPLSAVVGDGDHDLYGGYGNWTNNGVFAIRNSCWSRQFLRDWWLDGSVDPNPVVFDNGAFTHAVFRSAARDAGLRYENECMVSQAYDLNCFEHWIRSNAPGKDFCWRYPCSSRHLSLVGDPAFNKGPDSPQFDILPSDYIAHFPGHQMHAVARAVGSYMNMALAIHQLRQKAPGLEEEIGKRIVSQEDALNHLSSSAWSDEQ